MSVVYKFEYYQDGYGNRKEQVNVYFSTLADMMIYAEIIEKDFTMYSCNMGECTQLQISKIDLDKAS